MGLVLTSLASLLGRFVLELSKIHNLADRRLRIRGYFDKVEICFQCQSKRFINVYDTDLLSFHAHEANLWDANPIIDSWFSADMYSFVRWSALSVLQS
jgi:hypothetical protein